MGNGERWNYPVIGKEEEVLFELGRVGK